MKRETRFVHSHKGFAVNLASLRVEPSDTSWHSYYVSAAWYRGTVNAPMACIGYLHDHLDGPVVEDAREFLERSAWRHGSATCLSRWTGVSFWTALDDPAAIADDLAFLKEMLANYPNIPDGHDGWWRF